MTFLNKHENPLAEIQQETEIKVTLVARLKRIIKELQVTFLEHEGPVTSDTVTNNLCCIIEASFLHGIKGKLWSKTVAALKNYNYDEDPSLNFWGFVKVISHPAFISFIVELPQIITDIGRCRAWVRLAISDGSLHSYLAASTMLPPSVLGKYYKRTAFMRDPERPGILSALLQGVSSVRFELPYNSSVLNQWNNATLLLAGVPVSQRLGDTLDGQIPIAVEAIQVEVPEIALAAASTLASRMSFEPSFDPTRITQQDIDDLLSLKSGHPESVPSVSDTSDISQPDPIDKRQSFQPVSSEGSSTSLVVEIKKVKVKKSKVKRDPEFSRTELADVVERDIPIEAESQEVEPSDTGQPISIYDEGGAYQIASSLRTEVVSGSLPSDIEERMKEWQPKSMFERRKTQPDIEHAQLAQADVALSGSPIQYTMHPYKARGNSLSIDGAGSWSETVQDLSEALSSAVDEQQEHDSDDTHGVETEQRAENGINVPIIATEALEVLNEYVVLTEDVVAVLQCKTAEELRELFTTLPQQKGIAYQNFKCASCRRLVGFIYGKPRVCSLDGLYYCHECHENEVYYIPSRIVHNWDFTKYPVCKNNLVVLQENETAPLINLNQVNPKAYQFFKSLQPIQILRQQLVYLRAYLFTCSPEIAQELRKHVSAHLLEHPHLYSLQNLLHTSTLCHELEQAVTFASQHVKKCTLCSQKGFICQICNNPSIIYPFQVDSTYMCPDCESVFHRQCKTSLVHCPKCQRLKERRMNVGSFAAAQRDDWDYACSLDLQQQ